MLGVGEKFPSYSLNATVGIDSDPKAAFKTITDLEKKLPELEALVERIEKAGGAA